jgi:hypothetical protein
LKTADALAAEHGISAPTVRRAAEFSRNVDTIAEVLGEEVRPALLSGQEKVTRQEVAEIAVTRAALATRCGIGHTPARRKPVPREARRFFP